MHSNTLKYGAWIVLAILARVMPHPANLTPFASLIMLSGCQLSKRGTVVMTFLSLLISDILLAVSLGYPVFGSWTVFTYSGFLLMALASSMVIQKKPGVLKIAGFAVSSVLLYWLWTNLGSWLLAGIYPHTFAGLAACFVAGLPFLKSSLFSALVFVPLLFGLLHFLEKTWQFKTN